VEWYRILDGTALDERIKVIVVYDTLVGARSIVSVGSELAMRN
jgi:hypothetical protein